MDRKEAIEIIRKNWPRDIIYSEALCTLIPELVESKDERIRQFLIHEVTETSDKIMSYRNMNKKDVLAWLEKHKEFIDKEGGDFTIYHPVKNGNGEYECIPYSFYGTLSSFSKDKDIIDFLRSSFYSEQECIEWIEKQGEQKQEWSKKDEYHLESILCAVEETCEDGCDKEKLISWIKCLKHRFYRKEQAMKE